MNDSSQAWWDNFKGRCISCSHSCPSTRIKEVLCQNRRAWDHGLPGRPGGSKFSEPVHKLFGCVYFAPIVDNRVNVDSNVGIIKPKEGG